MTFGWRTVAFVFAIAGLLGLVSCGSDEEATSAGAAAADEEEASSGDTDDEDHDDEEHDDDDHDDEDHDDHDDEDHDDHDDEDHDDEDHDDHDDEDHDDHDDEDHDDEDHDDDGDGDHDDDDHDDHDDDSSSGLGAHEHGVAELSVAWSGSDLVIELLSPAFNIVGSEKEPSTDEEQELFDDRTATLAGPGMIVVNDEASCELTGDAVTETEFEGSHSEILTSWSFVCDNPDEISQLETAALFSEFPNLEDIDVQWVSDTGQSSAELTPSETALIFE